MDIHNGSFSGGVESRYNPNAGLTYLVDSLQKDVKPAVSPQRAASVNAVMGSLSLHVPVFTSPGRSGFGPQLGLTYSSGMKNGAFGLGWELGIPTVQRKTQNQIPQYGFDRGEELGDEDDVYVISGMDDLVPVSEATVDAEWRVRKYEPRTQQESIRIERWTSIGASRDEDVYWRTISADGITTVFGRADQSRVFDSPSPADGTRKRIFSWLITETFDTRGNAMQYVYKEENTSGIDLGQYNQKDGARVPDLPQRYLKRIRYGNRTPNRQMESWKVGDTTIPHNSWLFEVVFDYGEHDDTEPTTIEVKPWNLRRDPFSSSRSGFEIRTFRLCHRILMFHHMPERLNGRADVLVSSTILDYDEDSLPGSSLLMSVTEKGHAPDLVPEALPPITFAYNEMQDPLECSVQTVDCCDLANTNTLMAAGRVEWLDLNCDGLPGFLVRENGSWQYQRNESAATPDGTCSFGPSKLLTKIPHVANGSYFVDLGRRGKLGLLCSLGNPSDQLSGYFERSPQGEWTGPTLLNEIPNVDLSKEKVWMIDLTGNGMADVLRLGSQEEVGIWYRCLGTKGFDSAQRVIFRDELGPGLGDVMSHIYMADMNGDGLADVVQIQNGSVIYWPNQGYGEFGPRVAMGNVPTMPQFTPKRLRFGDVTGSGTSDIVYLPAGGGAWIYFNEAGNRWSEPYIIGSLPEIDDTASVALLDLLGRGTLCLCWFAPRSAPGRGGSLCYVDLMGAQNPGLLRKYHNGLGKETSVNYAPSTKFYLKDEFSGNPWKTQLSFPIQCVEQIITVDRIMQSTTNNTYKYHDGYYDTSELEFRGFGMVDQSTVETFSLTGSSTSECGGFETPGSRSRRWFHLGRRSDSEYLPPNMILPASESDEVTPEAYRALKGLLIREEIYSPPNPPAEPFRIWEHVYRIQTLRLRGGRPGSGIYRLLPKEDLECHPEPGGDHRLQHEMVLAVDDHGRRTKTASIAYGKRASTLDTETDRSRQEETILLYTEIDYTNPINTDDDFRLPLPSETRGYRVFLPPRKSLFRFSDLAAGDCDVLRGAPTTEYDPEAPIQPNTKVLVHRSRSLYRSSDLSRQLPVGVIESYSVLDQSFKLAFTSNSLSATLSSVTGGLNPPTLRRVMETQGGYRDVDGDNCWWIPSGRLRYAASGSEPLDELKSARKGFYIPTLHIDQWGAHTITQLEDYGLFATKQTDDLGNTQQCEYDYIALTAKTVTDANRNRTMFSFDALRRLVGTAIGGKQEEKGVGDSLEGFRPQLTLDETRGFLTNPRGALAVDLLGSASQRVIYSSADDARDGRPAFEVTISRENSGDTAQHRSVEFTHLNGSGTPIQNISLVDAERWRIGGRCINDDNGQPVRTFHSLFSASHDYHELKSLSTDTDMTIFRDPTGSTVGALYGDHTWEKSICSAWSCEVFDSGDTVLIRQPEADPDLGSYFEKLTRDSFVPAWRDRMNDSADAQDKMAARASEVYADTPTVTHTDALGRKITVVQNNGIEKGKYTSRFYFDIFGNICRVENARGVTVSKVWFDMCSRPMSSVSADSGRKWTLSDCLGRPLFSWDGRKNRRRYKYDTLGRLEEEWSLASTPGSREILITRWIFGEKHPAAAKNNLLTRPYQRYDQAGMTQSDEYDHRGNCTKSSIRIAENYKEILDWSKEGDEKPSLQKEVFSYASTFNLRDQESHTVLPDGSSTHRTYGQDGKLRGLQFTHTSSPSKSICSIDRIAYTPDGNREQVEYGNKTLKTFEFEEISRQLKRSEIRRQGSSQKVLQNLTYSRDCCHRTLRTCDAAAQDVYFRGATVRPVRNYSYDALGRLEEARGREQFDGSGGKRTLRPYSPIDVCGTLPGDGNQICQYVERYQYDEAGNICSLQHAAGGDSSISGWTRRYRYEEKSYIDQHETSDRLSSSAVGNTVESYGYDGQGCLVASSLYYTSLTWDFNNRLRSSSTQVVNTGTPETTWYVYDRNGQRLRKVTERCATPGGSAKATKLKETMYLPGYQEHRSFRGDGVDIKSKVTTSLVLEAYDGDLVAVVEHKKTSSTEARPLVRYQASETLELGDEGQVVSYEEYSPFGASTYKAVGSTIDAPRRYRFASCERDSETGMDHCGERYYIPWLGRWSSPDPLGILDGLNRYNYVGNNPIGFEDKKGTSKTPREGRGREREEARRSSAPYPTSTQAPRVSRVGGSTRTGPGNSSQPSTSGLHPSRANSATGSRPAVPSSDHTRSASSPGDIVVSYGDEAEKIFIRFHQPSKDSKKTTREEKIKEARITREQWNMTPGKATSSFHNYFNERGTNEMLWMELDNSGFALAYAGYFQGAPYEPQTGLYGRDVAVSFILPSGTAKLQKVVIEPGDDWSATDSGNSGNYFGLRTIPTNPLDPAVDYAYAEGAQLIEAFKQRKKTLNTFPRKDNAQDLTIPVERANGSKFSLVMRLPIY
ncbi:65kDa B protein-domain-containing protein [Xylaria grammica]|nr:65kDa B protein-domain-containing protein [Xylaria grammica]